MPRPRSFDRDAALDQAMRAFWAKGYERTSISDLTKAMGIAPPSLYAAFGDKDRLFAEAVRRYQADPGAPIHAALEAPTARASIAGVLTAAAREYARADTPRGCFVLSEPRLVDERERSHASLRDRLQRGVDSGELPPGTDIDALAGFFGAVMTGMSARARDGATRQELEAIAETAMAAWPVAVSS